MRQLSCFAFVCGLECAHAVNRFIEGSGVAVVLFALCDSLYGCFRFAYENEREVGRGVEIIEFKDTGAIISLHDLIGDGGDEASVGNYCIVFFCESRGDSFPGVLKAVGGEEEGEDVCISIGSPLVCFDGLAKEVGGLKDRDWFVAVFFAGLCYFWYGSSFAGSAESIDKYEL